MDPQVQASFIPKKPLVSTAVAPSGARAGLVWFAAILLFIASLIAAGAAFGYERYLAGSLRSKSQSLARAQASYDPSVIADLLRLDQRIDQAETLLQSHLAPSGLFGFLAQNTLTSVRFTNFSYTMNPNGAASLALSGTAPDFSSVALQSDQFSKSRLLKDVLFSDVNVDPQTGGVVFRVAATADPSLISYRGLLTQGAPAPGSASGASASSSASSPSSPTP